MLGVLQASHIDNSKISKKEAKRRKARAKAKTDKAPQSVETKELTEQT